MLDFSNCDRIFLSHVSEFINRIIFLWVEKS